ncbi:MAG: LacI family DNA-binding transcriptional regulator, partial [Saprospiraceae bacterium]|nr:LacI family DNA-binding transcriptional regulator [Saprospiraceae bacterium]
MKKVPRLKDIAELAEVSIGTVDRVLHNRGRVALKTREKVLTIAKDVGYQPNIHASMLANSNRNYQITILIPQKGMDPFWDRVHVGLVKALTQIGQQNVKVTICEFDLFDPVDFSKKASALDLTSVDGMIIAPIFYRECEPHLNEIHKKRIPYVLINTLVDSEHSSFLSYIGPNSYQSGRLAARLLAQHCTAGEKVLMIPLEKDFSNAHHMIEKERGFRDCFLEIAPFVKVITVEFEDYDDPEALADFLTKRLRKYPSLKGIYTSASRIDKIAAFFQAHDVHHVKLIGYDTLDENLKYLDSGHISYLINQNPNLMGYLSLIYLSKYLVFSS